jgi:hypothetical protein
MSKTLVAPIALAVTARDSFWFALTNAVKPLFYRYSSLRELP